MAQKSIEIALKFTKMTKSKRRQKRIKNLTPNETKNNNTSSHMLLDHCYAFSLCCSLPKKMFFREGDPRDLFWPCPGSTPGRIWHKSQYKCAGPYEKKLYGTYMSKLYVKYRGHIIVKYMSHICILNVNEVEDI